jgi:hypothetical protein
MAKALLGYLGGPDPRMMAEIERLRRRVGALEDEVLRLRADNDALAAQVDRDRLVAADITDSQPALA